VCIADARCEVLRAAYNDLARELAAEGLHPLAAIDCFSWTDACQLANVSEYPHIRVYRPNADFLPYHGYLSKAALHFAIKLYVYFYVFTMLHGMQTLSSDENSVCLSVCLSNA